MAVQHYRQLIAWQKAMELVDLVYDLTDDLPPEERFGLSLQVRRAVVSIASNIAEGQGRNSTKEFINHLSIAYGSLMETETQTLVAELRSYSTPEKRDRVMEKASEVGRLINGLSNSLGRRTRPER
ncbi:MAG: four helix bundle protein [Pyrinomonadaceae bacterium]